jgi:hypothetical protein
MQQARRAPSTRRARPPRRAQTRDAAADPPTPPLGNRLLNVNVRIGPGYTLDVNPQAAAGAVIAAWRRGDLTGRKLGELTREEALALERPA